MNLASESKRVPAAEVAASIIIRGKPPNDLPPQERTVNPTKVQHHKGWRMQEEDAAGKDRWNGRK